MRAADASDDAGGTPDAAGAPDARFTAGIEAFIESDEVQLALTTEWPNGSEDGRDDGEDAAEDTADGGGEDSEDDPGLTSPTATMLTSLLDADPASPLPTAATAVAAWFAHGHARGELKLGLLPFLLEHAMLPGERRCVFLFDDSLRECVAAASASHSCVGGLLFNPDGNHYELTTLLRIEEIKEKSESCTWVQLAAVGRCKISSVRKNKLHGYRLAIVSPFSDEGSAAKPNPSLEAVHAEVASQRRQLAKDLTAADEFDSGTWASQGREAPLGEYKDGGGGGNEYIFVGADSGRACFGVYDSYEAMEETGVLCEHVYVGLPWERPTAMGCCYFNARDLGELDDAENGASLAELVNTRRAVLTGGAERGLLELGRDAWGVTSEEEAHLQLSSFAAAATLSPMDRAQALLMKDTAQRREFVQEALAQQQSLLAGLLTAAGPPDVDE